MRDVCLLAQSLVVSTGFSLSCTSTYTHLQNDSWNKHFWFFVLKKFLDYKQMKGYYCCHHSIMKIKMSSIFIDFIDWSLADFVKKHFENLVKLNQSCNLYIKFLKFGEKLIINLTWFFSHFSNVQKMKMPDIQHQCQFLMLQFDNKIIHIFLSWKWNNFDYGGH